MADVYISNVTQSSENTLHIACGVFLALTWLIVLLRTWVRAVVLRAFGWDDGLMIFTNVRFAIRWMRLGY